MALSKWVSRKEMESWGDRQADMRLHVEVREKKELLKTPQEKRFLIQERRAEQNSRGIPSCAVPCSLRYRASVKSHLSISRGFFQGGMFELFHTCTHSQFGDAQFVVSVSNVQRPKHAATSAGIDRRVTMHDKPLLQSVVSHWRFSWWTFQNKTKSHRKRKTSRDGKRSAMYRLNRPLKTKTNSWIMAQVLVFFATLKCSPHVIKWFLCYWTQSAGTPALKRGFQLSLCVCPQLPKNK